MLYAYFRAQLLAADAPIRLSSNFMEAVITLAYVLVIVAGTIGTLYFGRKSIRKAQGSGSEEE